MRLSTLTLHTLTDRVERRWLNLFILGLLLINLILAIQVFSTRTVVTLVPPGMNQATRVSLDQASAQYKKAWGVFIAELLGNATPQRMPFVLDTLKPLLGAGLYQKVIAAIHAQAQDIKRNHISVAFAPKKVTYDPTRNLVFVSGRQTTSGPGGPANHQYRTYEIKVAIAHYQPVIQHLSVYNGKPHTKERP